MSHSYLSLHHRHSIITTTILISPKPRQIEREREKKKKKTLLFFYLFSFCAYTTLMPLGSTEVSLADLFFVVRSTSLEEPGKGVASVLAEEETAGAAAPK
jgi:hypothetical protein